MQYFSSSLVGRLEYSHSLENDSLMMHPAELKRHSHETYVAGTHPINFAMLIKKLLVVTIFLKINCVINR